MYSFDTPGAIFGVEWYSPNDTNVVPGGLWEVSVYSDGGAIVHRQYYGGLAAGAGWKKIYFDTPFPVQVTTPIPTRYMICVGFPNSGSQHVRAYSPVVQTTVRNGAIFLNSGGNTYYTDGIGRGYPQTTQGVGNLCFRISPLFSVYDYTGVTLETTADDTTTVVTTLPAAKLSERLIKARGAGYGRYFQTKLTQVSTGPFSLYGLQWMNEKRGIQPNAGPNRNV
jgi:hypothetical protein